MIIAVTNIYWALTVYKPGRPVHESIVVCKHPVNSSYFHAGCTQGHTAAKNRIRTEISSQAKGPWTVIGPLSACAKSGLFMTLIVFLCMKQNVCLPKEMLLCLVIWREELWVVWNSVTHSHADSVWPKTLICKTGWGRRGSWGWAQVPAAYS